MNAWLHTAVDAAVLVTVAATEGSAPRAAGARMLVDARRQWDTIGGGHLEWRAVAIARAMLEQGEERRLERFPLGPGLGQCCGGVVYLAFERVDAAYMATLAARAGAGHAEPAEYADFRRRVALDGAPERTLDTSEPGEGTRLWRDGAGRRWLLDAVPAPRPHLMLFGAGHVGAAIVRVLAQLPCRVTWVDEREDAFPADLPHNARVEASDAPEALAALAPPGTSFLVMTHSHALDGRLAETILKRADPGWFGLIGSATKRAQFERRLLDRGVARDRLDAMVCPVGLPGIAGKEPGVIAVAVAAQLLTVWERKTVPDAFHESPGTT